MKNRLAFILLAVLAGGVAVLVATSGQSQSTYKQQTQKKEDVAPTVDFDAPEPTDQREKDIRKKRGGKYKSRIPLDKSEDEANIFEIPPPHSAIEPAFPIDQSDLIVIGTITDSRAFISNDKSAVYSEFQVTVNQVFRNRGDQVIVPESSLVAERVGGNVRFASGKVQRRGDSGHNLPQIGKQYVLFLKWDEQGKDHLILTGYEVRGDIVYPLDGLKEGNPRIFSNYSRYKNANFLEFMSELQAAIANAPRGGQ